MLLQVKSDVYKNLNTQAIIDTHQKISELVEKIIHELVEFHTLVDEDGMQKWRNAIAKVGHE